MIVIYCLRSLYIHFFGAEEGLQHFIPVVEFTFDRRLSAALLEALTAPTPLPEI
jgi:hypothetical protein